jgi:hypothetical protein
VSAVDESGRGSDTLLVPSRFIGPPGTANGGYLSGQLAMRVGSSDPVVVTLRRPPPVDIPMSVALSDGGARLTVADQLIAEAVVDSDTQLEPVPPVRYELATAAEASYPGLTGHPFPGCFVCGVDRSPPDILALRPGRLADREGDTGCAWVPDASLPRADTDPNAVSPAIVWAVLDCPGGWTQALVGRPAVLGRLTAVVDRLPAIGEPCIVVGRPLGADGRKAYTSTTLYGADGRPAGRATAVWISIDPAALTPSE